MWTFTGVNAYEAATEWGVNAGCGTELSNSALDTLFSSLKPNDAVRFWAFQALATNYTTKKLDWGPIDRVINAAARYGVKVIPALAGESGGCDDEHWKDIAWYDGGYMKVYDSTQWPASTPLSYWDYMQAFLNRYKDNPTIAMIELVSEPAPTDPNYVCVSESQAAHALRYFFDTVGGEAHRIDPNHLIESGSQGVGQCGQQDQGCTTSSWTSCSVHDYEYTEDSPAINVASYHDYDGASTTISLYLSVSLGEARAIGKPLVVGEAGMHAQNSLSGCISDATRASDMRRVMSAQFAAGVRGFLAWDWVPSNPGGGDTCSYDIGPADPLVSLLANW